MWEWGAQTFFSESSDHLDKLKPKRIGDEYAEIALGSNHAFMIKSDGSLMTCGQNDQGQLGNGTHQNKLKPTKINLIKKLAPEMIEGEQDNASDTH